MWLANLLVQILGLLGFALLSIPAFYAAKYGKLLVDAEAARPVSGSGLAESFETALKALANHRDGWKAWKGWCLIWGTLSSIASYALATYVAYVGPAAT